MVGGQVNPVISVIMDNNNNDNKNECLINAGNWVLPENRKN